MNYDMVRRWNDVVEPDDRVFHLGDFAMGDPIEWPKWVIKLNGRITLVLDNHDRSVETMLGIGFAEVVENVVVSVDGSRLWLNHFPPSAYFEERGRPRKYVRPEPPAAYDIALCGHVHEKWTTYDNVVNVGVDRWNFTPISLEQIVSELA
jgi:calcineurin-like phosphoesterase family protein